MFDSLDERIKQDEPEQASLKGRILRYSMIAIISVGIFVALYEALQRFG